jgi:copper chaperone CopZ
MRWFPSKSPQPEIVISVGGMSCDGCARGLTKKLLATPGVSEVHVTLHPRGEARVRGTASEEDVRRVIILAGYTTDTGEVA